jgi:hypothetical protein
LPQRIEQITLPEKPITGELERCQKTLLKVEVRLKGNAQEGAVSLGNSRLNDVGRGAQVKGFLSTLGCHNPATVGDELVAAALDLEQLAVAPMTPNSTFSG